LPIPSHTTPLLSVHVTPLPAKVDEHLPPEQAGVAQTVSEAGQSASWRQATHDPLPSQSWPPSSLHIVPAAALLVPQACWVEQVLLWHLVVTAGQSAGIRQPTQLPSPSQTLPPLAAQGVSAAALVVPQQESSQVALTQVFVGVVQPAGVEQLVQAPPVPPVPEELVELDEAVPLELLDEPAVPLPPVLAYLNVPRTSVQALATAPTTRSARPVRSVFFIEDSLEPVDPRGRLSREPGQRRRKNPKPANRGPAKYTSRRSVSTPWATESRPGARWIPLPPHRFISRRDALLSPSVTRSSLRA
jgi:hypothetical protein